jgi:hypothetical protein
VYVYSTVLYFRKYGSNDTEVLSYESTSESIFVRQHATYCTCVVRVRVHVQYSGSDVLSKIVLFRKYDTSQSLHTVRKYGITVRVLPDR